MRRLFGIAEDRLPGDDRFCGKVDVILAGGPGLLCRPFHKVTAVLFVQQRERIPFVTRFNLAVCISVNDDRTARCEPWCSGCIAGRGDTVALTDHSLCRTGLRAKFS